MLESRSVELARLTVPKRFFMLFAPVFRCIMGAGQSGESDWTAVKAHLRRLDTPALGAFVADLWGQRGFDVERDGATLRASRDGDRHLICVGSIPSDIEAASVDVVVDPSGGTYERTRVVGVRDLTEQLRYAVARPVASGLCERHFGDPLGALPMPATLRVRRAVGHFPEAAGVVLILAALAVMGLGAATALGLFAPGTNGTTTATADGGTETPVGPVLGRELRAGQAVINQPLPPGVTPNGISNLNALADSHTAAVGNRSYTLLRETYWTDIRDREEVTVTRDINTTVEGGAYRIDTDEIVDSNRTQVGVLYHDGQNSYVAPTEGAEAEYRRLSPLEQAEFFPQPPSSVTASLVETRLSTPTTSLATTVERHNRTLFRLTGRGQPDWPTIGSPSAYNVTALVSLDGFVREVDLRYTVQSGNRLMDVRHVLQYRRIDETTVTPPAWYGATSDRNDIGG